MDGWMAAADREIFSARQAAPARKVQLERINLMMTLYSQNHRMKPL
jgi:hypothetical protein